MIGREKRVLLRHYLEQGMDEGGDRPAGGREPRHDLSLDRDGTSWTGIWTGKR